MLIACSFPRDKLIGMGAKIGKFNQKRKFRLHITALDVISPLAKYKVWVKPSSEMGFLYGNHIPKMGLGRMTESIPQYAGVIVCNMAGLALGFGLAAQTTEHCRTLDPNVRIRVKIGFSGFTSVGCWRVLTR